MRDFGQKAPWPIDTVLPDHRIKLPGTPSDQRHSDTALSDAWPEVIKSFRALEVPLPAVSLGLFGPLRQGRVDDLVVVGQIGQSLDGRIATATGHSHYINGPAGLDHLHRLRAVVDAVVVGVGTAIADDPQLTVRRVTGANPVRVVIDPRGRLPVTARLLAANGTRRIVIGSDKAPALAPGVEWIPVRPAGDHLAPADILAALARSGLRRILIEGGANTVSRFLAAGCLDRLHVVVAPIVLGSGPTGISLPPIDRVDEALRPPMHVHRLGDEILFDCDLSAYRRAIGVAKKST